MSNIVKTTCSGCATPAVVDLDEGEVRMIVPSNGKRGRLHRGAHNVAADLTFDDTLAMWDCPMPGCDQADSVYIDADVRADLS